jgi:hypothetical protein
MKTIGNIIWIIFGGLHIDWHTVRKDAFPSGKVGFIPLRQSSRLINGQRKTKRPKIKGISRLFMTEKEML